MASPGSSTEKLYLGDLGHLLKEMAFKAKRRSAEVGPEGREFELGRLTALHEVISLMQSQASAFALPLSDLNLADIVPERDLL